MGPDNILKLYYKIVLRSFFISLALWAKFLACLWIWAKN